MKRRSALFGLLLAVLALGCETGTDTLDPSAPTVQGPENLLGLLDSDDDDGDLLGLNGLLGSGLRLVQTVVYVVGDVGEALIGPVGGVLGVDGHELEVPPGAVSHETLFTMDVLDGDYVGVDLSATDPDTGDDVGGKGFHRPVQLALSYDDARVSSWNIDDLVIVRINDDGTHEVLPSTVNRETKQVIAELDHFSKYMLCRN